MSQTNRLTPLLGAGHVINRDIDRSDSYQYQGQYAKVNIKGRMNPR